MKSVAAVIDPAPYASLGELLRDALVQFKTNTALVEVSRKRESGRWTYLDMKRAAAHVAQRLSSAGIGAGDRVAIVMSNQARWLIGATGALLRGAVLVPIDYKLTAEEQRALIAHAKPRVLLTEYAMWQGLRDCAAELTLVTGAPPGEALGDAERWEAMEGGDAAAPVDFVPRERQDVACIVYSSGTGGTPKGCMLTHDNYLEQLRSLSDLFPMTEGHRFFSILPTNHAIDFMVGFIGPLTGGATIVHQRALRPELIRWTMQRYRITHMALVPLILQAFERAIEDKLDAQSPTRRSLVEALGAVNAALTQRKPRATLSRSLLKPIHDAFGGSLEILFCGGAFVDPRRAELFYRLGIPVVIGYGLTEACTVATLNDLRPFRSDSVGRPVAGVEVRVASPDARGVGEVLIRGRTVMKGYLDEPELTAATIRDGWLHTGDLGSLDAAGHLHLVGRAKNMVVTAGGKNVYPEDVEATFEGLDCEELAIVASNFIWPTQGMAEGKLLAVVRAEACREAVLGQVRDRNRRLPDYKRVHGVLPWPTAFPRTASMKLKREALAAELRGGTKEEAVLPL